VRIVEQYSHLNGLEYLLVHKPQLWKEIQQVIAFVNASAHKTKISKEKRMIGKALFSPVGLNDAVRTAFKKRGWSHRLTKYWVTHDAKLIRKTMNLPADAQKKELVAAGVTPIYSYNQTDFVKDRVAVEVQLGKYSFVAYDLFVKHLAFYVGDVIDVGVEIVPMKELQSQMSSGAILRGRAL